jgi:drug/metabolite transporter (DMT)-like permease
MAEHSVLILRVSGWMLLTITSFAGMAVAAREMSGDLPVLEMMVLRSFIGLLILTAIMFATGQSFYTPRPVLNIVRNLFHFSGTYCWTVGVLALPLAQVFAIEFTVPVWTALVATLFLGERMSVPRLVAIVGGFIGVLMVVRPGVVTLDPMTFVVLAAAWFFAGSVLMVKVLTRTESVLTIMFYMTLIQLPLGIVLAWPDMVIPPLSSWPWILVFGVGGLTAHLGLTKALSIADASVVLPMDYLRLPVIALVGVVAYNEPLNAWVLLGAAVIMGSNYLSIQAERHRKI